MARSTGTGTVAAAFAIEGAALPRQRAGSAGVRVRPTRETGAALVRRVGAVRSERSATAPVFATALTAIACVDANPRVAVAARGPALARFVAGEVHQRPGTAIGAARAAVPDARAGAYAVEAERPFAALAVGGASGAFRFAGTNSRAARQLLAAIGVAGARVSLVAAGLADVADAPLTGATEPVLRIARLVRLRADAPALSAEAALEPAAAITAARARRAVDAAAALALSATTCEIGAAIGAGRARFAGRVAAGRRADARIAFAPPGAAIGVVGAARAVRAAAFGTHSPDARSPVATFRVETAWRPGRRAAARTEAQPRATLAGTAARFSADAAHRGERGYRRVARARSGEAEQRERQEREPDDETRRPPPRFRRTRHPAMIQDQPPGANPRRSVFSVTVRATRKDKR